MRRPDSDLDPEIEALLKPHRIKRQVPPDLRARALARARATLAGEPVAPAPTPPAVPIVRGQRLLRIAVAASIVIGGAALGAIAGLQVRSARAPQDAPEPAPPARVPVANVARATTEPPAPEPAPVKPLHAARHGAKVDPFTAELALMQRAHAAFTRHDFSVALTIIGEHARRFPRGQLAEQREALRVRALLGAGRAEEAQRAAAAFAVRFPRSVLLSRAQDGSEGSASSER